MRVKTSGVLRRIDPSPLVALVPPLLDEWIAHVDTDLRDLAERVDQERGEAAFVHRGLWDPGFDPTSPGASG